MDNYGVSFAPTQENAQQGPLNAQIDGLPAAIKILALRFPRVLGAQSVASPDLLNAPGAQGIDPIASAVLATMARAIATHAMGSPMGAPTQNAGLPGGTAGPALGPVTPSPFPSPSPNPVPQPSPLGNDFGKPRVTPIDNRGFGNMGGFMGGGRMRGAQY